MSPWATQVMHLVSAAGVWFAMTRLAMAPPTVHRTYPQPASP